MAEMNEKAKLSHSTMEMMGGNEEEYSNLSKEELSLKVNMFTKLCFTNKINASNAFDIDMIGYFKSWLIKNKNENCGNVSSFTEIASYLEASQKIYSCRVDSCSETTSKLVEEFRSLYYKKNMLNTNNENEKLKTQKPKRTKFMLTKSEKLRRKPTEDVVIPHLKVQGFTNMDYKMIFEDGDPSRFMKSLYSGSTVKDELDEILNNEKEEIQNNDEFIELPNYEIDFENAAICHEFKNSAPKPVNNDLKKDNSLEGIEYHFEPDTNMYNLHDETGSSPVDQMVPSLSSLVECIDNVNRDYSFFNPQRLAKWKGPKEWKAQAMLKALKSCNPNEQKKIISGLDICDDVNEIITKKTKLLKTNKKNNKGELKIEWISMAQIGKKMKTCIKGNEQLLPSTVKKWNSLNHIQDSNSASLNVVYKFTTLQYLEIKPSWWKKQNQPTVLPKEKNTLDTSSSHQITNDNEENEDEILNYNDIISEDIGSLETNIAEEINLSMNLISKNCEDICAEIKPESKINIGDLKKEIVMIINQECVEIDGKSEWSRRLPFLKLLSKLKVSKREGLSIGIIYVGLLHLANEMGLKLFEEHCPQYNNKQIFIAKPMNQT